MTVPDTISIATGALLLLLTCWAVVVSLHEREPRAALISLLLGLTASSPFVLGGLFFPGPHNLLLPGLLLLTLLILFLPRGTLQSGDTPVLRLDERDTMFSRRELQQDTSEYRQYYQRHPQLRERDDDMRKLPGLLAPGTSQFDAPLFDASTRYAEKVEALRSHVDGQRVDGRSEITPLGALTLLEDRAKRGGAVASGSTQLRDYHFYSVGGRAERYDREIVSSHTHAFVVAVEMKREMVSTAPGAGAVFESHRCYLEVGQLAVDLAVAVRELGYNARAHIDGNYQLVCPLVARDAGMGDIGRMGLLMTPRLGPRVRLAVVTTDLQLPVTAETAAAGVIEFCNLCHKCVTACPANAIPGGNRSEIAGVKRWQINSEACYDLWCRLGTDCGRCLSVCPWSHPDNLLHNLIRSGVRHFPLFRRLAVWLDDLLYGRTPPTRSLPPGTYKMIHSDSGDLS
jgi:ferredoxin